MIAIITEAGRLILRLLELWGVARQAPRLTDAEIEAEIQRIRKAYETDEAAIESILRGDG